MRGVIRPQLERKRSSSSKKKKAASSKNKKNDGIQKNKDAVVRRKQAARSCRTAAKKTDNVEGSDDDDTTDRQIQQIMDKQKQRNQEIHKHRNERYQRKRSIIEHSDAMKKQKNTSKRNTTIRNAEKDKVVENTDGINHQIKTREERLSYHAKRMKEYYHSKDPQEKQLMLDKKSFGARRRRVARQYGALHQMDYRDVLQLCKKNELIYDDKKRSFELNLPAIQARESKELTTDRDSSDIRVYPSIQNRIVNKNVEDGITYTNVKFKDDELGKLSICSSFIFGNNHIPTVASTDNDIDNDESNLHDTVTRSVTT